MLQHSLLVQIMSRLKFQLLFSRVNQLCFQCNSTRQNLGIISSEFSKLEWKSHPTLCVYMFWYKTFVYFITFHKNSRDIALDRDKNFINACVARTHAPTFTTHPRSCAVHTCACKNKYVLFSWSATRAKTKQKEGVLIYHFIQPFLISRVWREAF